MTSRLKARDASALRRRENFHVISQTSRDVWRLCMPFICLERRRSWLISARVEHPKLFKWQLSIKVVHCPFYGGRRNVEVSAPRQSSHANAADDIGRASQSFKISPHLNPIKPARITRDPTQGLRGHSPPAIEGGNPAPTQPLSD